MILPDRLLKLMSPEDRQSLGKAGTLASEAGAKCADKSEKAMQAEIQAYCDLRGWPCYRNRMDRKSTGRPGTPDFAICVPMVNRGFYFGAFVAIECKMPGNKPSEEQLDELEKVALAFGFELVATSSKEAIDWLKKLTGETP